ncbi:unnamed protein product [Clonostachys rosea]|uniref:Uncharacterized protein n=1 Tax=Bionectria ochroleuca TaxID=29856 RepID=A0ABY6U635_BIOOC|nr:unnamed protein product [Clonostachys rosea]
MPDGSSSNTSMPDAPGHVELAKEQSVVLRNIQGSLSDIKSEIQAMRSDSRAQQAKLEQMAYRFQNEDSRRKNRADVTKDPELDLIPLINPVTGEEIPLFPKNLEAFYLLSASEIHQILCTLNFKPEVNRISTLREMLKGLIM